MGRWLGTVSCGWGVGLKARDNCASVSLLPKDTDSISCCDGIKGKGIPETRRKKRASCLVLTNERFPSLPP